MKRAKGVFFIPPLLFLFFLLFWGKLISYFEEDQRELSILYHKRDERFPQDYPRDVPSELMPPSGYHIGIHYYASGFQVYTFNGNRWIHTNVSSQLRMQPGSDGSVQATHTILFNSTSSNGWQPTWINFHPFSLASGIVIAHLPVDPDPANTRWVLLEMVHNEGDSMILGSAKYAQRLNTLGGSPPTDTSAQVGDIYKSPYQATYWFWVKDNYESMDEDL